MVMENYENWPWSARLRGRTDLPVGNSGPRRSKRTRLEKDNQPREVMTMEAEEQLHQLRHDRCAKAALAHYHKKKRTNYKLVDAINSRAFVYRGIWYHCVFKAAIMPETETANDQQGGGDDDADHKMFFAELIQEPVKGKVVTFCRMIDGAETTYDGCIFCQGMLIPHHIKGYLKGQPWYEQPTLRPRHRRHD